MVFSSFGSFVLENMMLWVILSLLVVVVKGNNFPSLLTSNATLAIVIDRDYLGEEYESIKESLENYIIYAKREILKHGGVNVEFYSWTSINVKRDISAILSIASCTDTWRLFKAARSENLLHIAISESDCLRLPPSEAITVPLIIRGHELPQMFLDLRYSHAFKWKSIVVLYDTTLDRDLSTRVIKSLQIEATEGSAVSVIQLDTNSTGVKLRQTIKNTLMSISTQTVGSNFLALVGLDMVEIVMEYAKVAGLVTTTTQWLYVISDTDWRRRDVSHLKRLLKEGDNVAFAYNATVVDDGCVGGLKCHSEELLTGFTTALDRAVQEEYEMASQVSDEEWEAIRPSKLERRRFLLEQVKLFLREKSVCSNCTFWQFESGETWGKEYQKNSSTPDLLYVGSWSPTGGPDLKDEMFLHIAHGFRGRTLPMVTFHNPPWQIVTLSQNGSIVEYGGLVFDVIKELARNLNFTIQLEVIGSGSQKSKENSSNFYSSNNNELTNVATNHIPEAVVEMLKKKSIAMAACVFTISGIHEKLYMNFTVPISTQSYSFLAARPKELSRALLFMLPFTKDTWLCLSIAIILMGPILYYIHRFSPVYEYKGISMKGGLSSIQNCIWYMYGALLQQGGMHLPYADSARLVVGSWWLVVLVVATTYCGNLVAFLTFPKVDIPITTIDELLAHRDSVTWSVSKGSFLESQLKVTREPKFISIYRGMVNTPQNSEMIDRIERGKHVFIDWKMRLQFIMKKRYLKTDHCDFALGFEEFCNEQLGIAVPQDTPYLAAINKEIKRLHQVGLIQKWLSDYLPKRDKCWKTRHTTEVNNHTVNMDDMQGSFFVLFFGFLLSVLLILGEKIWHHYKERKTKKVIQPFAT